MALTDSITVLFHGNIESLSISLDQHSSQTTSCDLTCEDVIRKCIQHVQDKVCVHRPDVSINAPMYLPVFGLVSCPEERSWLPLSQVFTRTLERHRKYKFRVRFHPPADRFDDNIIMYEYLLLQTLDDFLKGPLGKSNEWDKQRLFGLLSIALLMPETLPLDGTKIVDRNFKSRPFRIWNFTNIFSKEIAKHFIVQRFVDQFWVHRALKSEMKKYKGHPQPQVLGFYKLHFYKLLMESKPHYCYEEYRAVSINKDKKETVTVNLVLYEGGKEPALYYGEVRQCAISEIFTLKLIKPKNSAAKSWHVEIDVYKGPPKILEFDEEGAAKSFITMVQGYYSLCVQYNTCLCRDLQTTGSKMSEELRSFGPLRPHTAESFLEDSCGVGNSSCAGFLIHESLTEFDQYVVVAPAKKDAKQGQMGNRREKEKQHTVLDIKCSRDKQFTLKSGEDEQSFMDSLELRKYLNGRFGQQVYPRNCSSVADISEDFRVEIENYGTDLFPRKEPEGAGSETFGVIKDDLRIQKYIPDKNPEIKVHKYEVYLNGEQRLLVELQSEKEKMSRSFREGLLKLLKLNRIQPSSFMTYYNTVLQAKLSVLLEFPPGGDLLTFICTHPQTVRQKVDIMYQMIKILGVMEMNKIFHGNIRLRRFMVFSGEEQGFAHIKLGDPGLSSYLDTLPLDNKDNMERVPWLSPERRKKLDEITYESECYATGTALCELMYRNDQFHEELKLEANKTVLEYLNAHDFLPCPPFLADTDEQDDNQDDQESRALLPEAKEVLEDVWKVILKCWAKEELERPSTTLLLADFKDICGKAGEIQADTNLDELKNVAYDAGMKKEAMKEGNRSLTMEQLEAKLQNWNQMFLSPACIYMNDYKDKLGSGYFGEVWKGRIRQPQKFLPSHRGIRQTVGDVAWTDVAVKKMKKAGFDQSSFIKEVLLACELKHPNIVSVLNLSWSTKGTRNCSVDRQYSPLMLIMEFMNRGTLSEYALNRGDLITSALVSEMLKICLDVAQGMVYLSGKAIVHRDLAARNILLSDQPDGTLTAKVSDFGLARTMEENYRFYRLNPEQALPFRWMPPECLYFEAGEGRFSTEGDVWSFGVMMWEAFSRGENPKKVIKLTKEPNEQAGELLEMYKQDWRLPKGRCMRNDVYDVMRKCWQMERRLRPPFVDLVEILKGLIEDVSQSQVS